MPIDFSHLSQRAAALLKSTEAAPVSVPAPALPALIDAHAEAFGALLGSVETATAPPHDVIKALPVWDGTAPATLAKAELDAYTAARVTLQSARDRMWGICTALDTGDMAKATAEMAGITEMLASAAQLAGLGGGASMAAAPAPEDLSMQQTTKAAVTFTPATLSAWIGHQFDASQKDTPPQAEQRLKNLASVVATAKALSWEATGTGAQTTLTVEMATAYAPLAPAGGAPMALTPRTDQIAREDNIVQMNAAAPPQPYASQPAGPRPAPAENSRLMFEPASAPGGGTNFASNGLAKALEGLSKVLAEAGIVANPAPTVTQKAAPVAEPKGHGWPTDLNKCISYGQVSAEPLTKRDLTWGADPAGLKG